jgi:hypothetical protein
VHRIVQQWDAALETFCEGCTFVEEHELQNAPDETTAEHFSVGWD